MITDLKKIKTVAKLRDILEKKMFKRGKPVATYGTETVDIMGRLMAIMATEVAYAISDGRDMTAEIKFCEAAKRAYAKNIRQMYGEDKNRIAMLVAMAECPSFYHSESIELMHYLFQQYWWNNDPLHYFARFMDGVQRSYEIQPSVLDAIKLALIYENFDIGRFEFLKPP